MKTNKLKRNQFLMRKWNKVAGLAHKSCDECGYWLMYYYRYDAEFCPNCISWKSKACGDPNCLYCNSRPDRPELELKPENIDKISENEFCRNYKTRKHYKDPLREKRLDAKKYYHKYIKRKKFDIK